MIGKAQKTTLDAGGVLNYKGRSSIPRMGDFISNLFIKSHGLRYFINPS